MSRNEIAAASGLRLSTVCSTVHRMLVAGEVRVCGTAWDDGTNRTVQLIKLLKERTHDAEVLVLRVSSSAGHHADGEVRAKLRTPGRHRSTR